MSHSKLGNKKNKPSHLRYNAENHRRRNKLARVRRFCGLEFASVWEKIHG